ncbi:hypothetical protein [Paraflavitalea speifideaquila]|nr:hypothetical protein [Paraflavitalea speifideiaquila]
MNFNTTLPNKLLPFKIPVRVFLDVGTYAEAWKKMQRRADSYMWQACN